MSCVPPLTESVELTKDSKTFRFVSFLPLIPLLTFLILGSLSARPGFAQTDESSSAEAGSSDDKDAREGEKSDGSSDEKEDEEDEEEEGFGINWGGEEETRPTDDITVSGQGVRELTISGVKLTGQFIQQSPGVYLAQGDITPDWDFDIKISAAGQLIVNKNTNKITGQMYIRVPVFGKIVQVTDLILSTSQIKFKGVFDQTYPIGPLRVQVAQAIVDFELYTKRIAVTAGAGASFNVTGIPGIEKIEIDLLSGDAGFKTAIPPESISVSGSGTVEIPFTPPIKVDLKGKLELKKTGVGGEGSIEVFELEVGNGSFDINTDGILELKLNAGIFKEGVVEFNVAGTVMTVNLLTKILTGALSQEIKILDMITVPGPVKADLTVDAKSKKMTIEGKAGIPLIGAVAPEAASLGIKNFKFEMEPYDTTNPSVKVSGEAYVSLWTFAGFTGSIENAVLTGSGDLNLPPGLNKLLDIDKITLPIRADLRGVQTLAVIGGDVSNLMIKHFPLEGPQIFVKNDGVHLKGQIGIANVITVPLGDLVFKKNESVTSVKGDIGLGPFTVAEGDFTLPTADSAPITFNGKLGIPGLSQKMSGNIYSDGKAELKSVNQLGILKVKNLSKFEVSKTGLHGGEASMTFDVGGLSECSLGFSSLDITPREISGDASVSFSNLVGARGTFGGSFRFDGSQVTLIFPNPVSFCGIDVKKVVLNASPREFSGSGQIVSPAGQTINVSISVENGALVLKDPAMKIIATGYDIAKDFANVVGDVASDEQEVISEDANKVLDNLSRMTEPWAKDAAAAVKLLKTFYEGVEKIVEDKILAGIKKDLEDLKKAGVAAASAVRKAIDGLVDVFCDAVLGLTRDIRNLIAKIESMVPDKFRSAYYAAKQRVINTATVLEREVENFRRSAKYALYHLSDTLTALYQKPLDYAGAKAAEIAGNIKRELDPAIAEVDALLTEIGQEIAAARRATGEEARRHYAKAEEKANIVQSKASNLLKKYKDGIDALLSPYIEEIKSGLQPYFDEVERVKNKAIEDAFTEFKTLQAELDTYLGPFREAADELSGVLSDVGGEALRLFNEGLKKAGDKFNGAVDTLGHGLVKATDVLGDAFVHATDFMADASNAIHDTAVEMKEDAEKLAAELKAELEDIARETKNKIKTLFNDIVNAKSNFQDKVLDGLKDIKSYVQRRFTDLRNKVAGTYEAGGATFVITPSGDVSMTVTETVMGQTLTGTYQNGKFQVSGTGQLMLGGFKLGGSSFSAATDGAFTANGQMDLPWVGSTAFNASGTLPQFSATGTKSVTLAGKSQDVTFTVTNQSVSGSGNFDLPLFGSTSVNFTGSPSGVSASASREVTILGKKQTVQLNFGTAGISGSSIFDLPILGSSTVNFTGNSSGLTASAVKSVTLAGKTQNVTFALTNTAASGSANFDLPLFGTTAVNFTGGANGIAAAADRSYKIAGKTQTVHLDFTPSSIAGSANYDLPLFGTTAVNFTGNPSGLTASASKSVSILGKSQTVDLTFGTGGISGSSNFDLPILGTSAVSFTGDANGLTASAVKSITLAGKTQSVTFGLTNTAVSGSADFDLPLFGTTAVNFTGGAAGITATADKSFKIAGKTQTVHLSMTPSSVSGSANYDLPIFGSTLISFTGDANGLTGSASRSVTIAGKTQTVALSVGSNSISGVADFDLPLFGVTSVNFTGDSNGLTAHATKSITLAGHTEEVTLDIAPTSITGDGVFDLPVFGSRTFHFSGDSSTLGASASLNNVSVANATFNGSVALNASGAVGTGSIELGGYKFTNATVNIASNGTVTVSASQNFTIGGKSVGFNLAYGNGSFSGSGSANVSLGGYSFAGTFGLSPSGVTVSGSNTFSIGGKSIAFGLNLVNNTFSASGTFDITVAGTGFQNCTATISSAGNVTANGSASITIYYPSPTVTNPFRILSTTATAALSYGNGKFSYSY